MVTARVSNTMRYVEPSQRQTPRKKHRRSAKGSTCTNCRQQKLKCNSANVLPGPCARCRQTGQRCVIDPLFRRRGNREYTRALEQEVQVLREVQIRGPPSIDSSRAEPNIEQSSVSGTSSSGVSPRFEHVSGQILEGVNLPSSAILSLIERYFTRYHPHFPILPDGELFILEYDSNRLLLWTILAIASRGLDDHPDLFSSIVDPVRKMAADIYAPQSRSLRTMQALLLLCVWPFPFQQTHNDPSPMFGSLATHIGYSLGLHRPIHKADFEEATAGMATSNAVERKAWYGCFIVNLGLSGRLGIPPTLTPGNAIISAVSCPSIPDIPQALLLELELSLTSYQWLKVLGDDESTSSGECMFPQHLIQIFDRQCNLLREKHPGNWSTRMELTFQALQLQVYSSAIDEKNRFDRCMAPSDVSSDILFTKAMSAVMQLVSSVTLAEEVKEYWPVFSKHYVMFAACVSVYLAAIARQPTTRATLLETCKNAISILASWSMFSKDSFARISRHIATAVHKIESQGSERLPALDEGSHKTRICARMAANIPYRVVWNAKHGKSPDPQYIIQRELVLDHNASEFPGTTPGVEASSTQDVSQSTDFLFNGLDDITLYDGMNEADFTDMLLDWQSLRGPIPDWTL